MAKMKTTNLVRLGALSAGLAMVFAPAIAYAAPSTEGELPDDIAAVTQVTFNDELFAASTLLEENGVLGARSELAKLVGDSRIAEDGAWELFYYAGEPESEQLLQRITELNQETALELRAIAIKVDPVRMNELAERVSLGAEEDLQSLGVSSVTHVHADTISGVLVIGTFDSDVVGTTTELEGVPVVFEEGAVHGLNSRDWDSAPWNGGVALRNTPTLGRPA